MGRAALCFRLKALLELGIRNEGGGFAANIYGAIREYRFPHIVIPSTAEESLLQRTSDDRAFPIV